MADPSPIDRILSKTATNLDATTVSDWFLLDGHRLIVAGLLLTTVLAALTTLLYSGTFLLDQRAVLSDLFSALIAGNLTLITVVISINQLVLLRELRSPRELRQEIDAIDEYIDDVEAETSRHVTPENPTQFLHVLLRSTRMQAAKLEPPPADPSAEANPAAEPRSAPTAGEEPFSDEIAELKDRLEETTEDMGALLEQSGVGLFTALSSILRYDFAAEIDECRWLRDAYADTLPEPTASTLEGIETRLEQLDVARQYIKTIYVQTELAYLSRVLLYVGFVAELLAVLLLLGMSDPGGPPFVTPGPVAAGITVSFAPFAVLFAYIMRMATVAQRTAAITPFTTIE